MFLYNLIQIKMEKIEISTAENELLKFLSIGKAYHLTKQRPVFMPVCVVDQAWHALLLDTKRYHTLTTRTIGSKVLHLEQSGEGYLEWVSEYEKRFGKLSKLWFTSSDGQFDPVAYDRYSKTGKIYTSWDCTPAYLPNEIKEDTEESARDKYSQLCYNYV